MDEAVHSAWVTVREYVKRNVHAAGYELGFQPKRHGNIFVTMSGVKVELSGYVNFPGNGMCLEVKARLSDSKVIITTSADCYFDPDIDFVVERTSPTAWTVTRVDPVDHSARERR